LFGHLVEYLQNSLILELYALVYFHPFELRHGQPDNAESPLVAGAHGILHVGPDS
jgi:hypothetical protein